jgi:hypothetical protein
MKELRIAHEKEIALRAAFAFDPSRAAILLMEATNTPSVALIQNGYANFSPNMSAC